MDLLYIWSSEYLLVMREDLSGESELGRIYTLTIGRSFELFSSFELYLHQQFDALTLMQQLTRSLKDTYNMPYKDFDQT